MNTKSKFTVPLSNIKNLNLEMGYQCNIRCNFCYQEDYSARLNMPSDIWEQRLTPIYPSLKKLTFIGGEPTIIKGAKEFSDFIVRHYPSIKLNTITNGLRFDKQWIDKFVSHGNKIIFSLNASSPEVYSQITKYSDWDKIMQNIKELVEARRAAKSPLIIEGSFLVLPDNVCDLSNFIRLCNDLQFNKAFFITPLSHQLKEFNTELLTIEVEKINRIKNECPELKIVGIEALIKSFFPGKNDKVEKLIEQFDEKSARDDSYYDKICKYPWNSLYVKHTGDVSVCCAAWLPIGNLYKNSLEEIWNSRQAKLFRKKMSQRDYSLCKKNCPLNIYPSQKEKDSNFVMIKKILYRFRQDPRMAFKKIKKELSR